VIIFIIIKKSLFIFLIRLDPASKGKKRMATYRHIYVYIMCVDVYIKA